VILWRHIKSEGHYWEVARGFMRATRLPVVIYAERYGQRVWVRATELFDDGRFEVVGHAEGSFPAKYPMGAIFEADMSKLIVLQEGDEFVVVPHAEWELEQA
jgi:hypothetical protein